MRPRFRRFCQISASLAIAAGAAACTSGTVESLRTTSPPTVSSAASLPSSTHRPSPTLRVLYTEIPTKAPPSATPTSNVTPSPTQALRGNGPLLAYLKQLASGWGLVLRDTDGIGATFVQVPNGFVVRGFPGALSPTGEWIALYSGSAGGSPWEGVGPGPYDLALSVMHLPDGEVRPVTGLLSSDYPHNFEVSATEVPPIDDGFGDSYNIPPEGFYQVFAAGIDAHAWSADGRFLAFAGEMDGPSSDLYVLDTRTWDIQRLSAGREYVQRIEWSPDGRWIAHSSALELGMGVFETWWAARADGSDVKLLPDTDNATLGWLDREAFSLYTAANGLGRGYLRTVNVETETIDPIWPHQFSDIAFALDGALIGVGTDYWEEDLGGFYLYQPESGEMTQLFEGYGWGVWSWENGEYAFLVTNDEIGTVAVRPDGSSTTISESPRWVSISPDKHWVGLRSNPGVQLYTPDGDVLVVSADTARAILWAPDSTGFYYFTESELYYVSVDDPDPVLIESGLPDPYDLPPAWIR